MLCRACGESGDFHRNDVCNKCKNGNWFKIDGFGFYRYSLSEIRSLTVKGYLQKYRIFNENVLDDLSIELVNKKFKNLENTQKVSLNDQISRLKKGVCVVHDPTVYPEELWFNLCTDDEQETTRLNKLSNETNYRNGQHGSFILGSSRYHIPNSDQTIRDYLERNELVRSHENWVKLELRLMAVEWQDLMDPWVDENTHMLSENDREYLRFCQKPAYRSELIKPTSSILTLHEKTVKIVRNYEAFGYYSCDAIKKKSVKKNPDKKSDATKRDPEKNDSCGETDLEIKKGKVCGRQWSSAHAWIAETQSCEIHSTINEGVFAYLRTTKDGRGFGDKHHWGKHCSACVRGDKCV